MQAPKRNPSGTPPGTANPPEASTANPPEASTANPPKASTANPSEAEKEFLYFFSCPVLTDNDLVQYFSLRRRLGEHRDFARILHAERKHFDDYENLLLAVRTFHGKAAHPIEKTHRKATEKDPFFEIRRVTENQKVLATHEEDTPEDRDEKDLLKKVAEVFKARILPENNPPLAQDWKARPFT